MRVPGWLTALIPVLGLFGGCIVENDMYNPNLDAGHHDLGPTTCSTGDRACLKPASSASCVNGSFVIDRYCPAGSDCKSGHCGVPVLQPGTPEGLSCKSETDCAIVNIDYSCVPFIVGGSAHWACDHYGTGSAGAPCQKPGECRSGACLPTGTCFRLCTSDGDCPIRNNVRLICSQVSVTVEGVSVSARSCVPPT